MGLGGDDDDDGIEEEGSREVLATLPPATAATSTALQAPVVRAGSVTLRLLWPAAESLGAVRGLVLSDT